MPAGVSFGNASGQWSSELDKGVYIGEIVCGGAKTYAYQTKKGKQVVKLKGITLDRTNGNIFTFEKLKEMVLDNTTLTSAPRQQFITNELTKNIEVKMFDKKMQSTVASERHVLDDHSTVPKGWTSAVEACS